MWQKIVTKSLQTLLGRAAANWVRLPPRATPQAAEVEQEQVWTLTDHQRGADWYEQAANHYRNKYTKQIITL